MPVNSFENYYLSWQPSKDKLEKPYYLSLASLLEADIRSGLLKGGTELPPQRELADYLDVHFTTVTKAYNECKRRNLIYGVTGSGTFVNPHAVKPVTNSLETVSKQRNGITDSVVEMGFISTFADTSTIIAKSLPEMFTRDMSKALNYSNPTGEERHKLALLDWVSQFGVHGELDQTAIVSGSLNALTICFLALFGKGSRILVDQYINMNVIELAKLFRIQLIPVKMDHYGMLPESLEQMCQQYSPTGIYLMPSCNNPTTYRIPARRRDALADIIRRYDLVVMEDDQYAFSCPGDISPIRELVPEQTIYICNTTHSLCSGLRVAFMVYPQRFHRALYNVLCNTNVKTSALDAEVICQLIESGTAHTIVSEKIHLAKQSQRLFSEVFPENYCGHPYCFFRWLEIPKFGPGVDLEQELLGRGVHVYHSNRFVCGKGDDREYLRIALSSAGSETEIRQGLKIIRDYFW